MYSAYGGHYDKCGWGYRPTFSLGSLDYWQRSLFQRFTAFFKVSGLPDDTNKYKWDKDAFLYGLFRLGFLTIFESRKYGVVPVPGQPYGIGIQFQPTGMTVATPYFQFDKPLMIGKDCEVLKLTPDYRGIWDIVDKYAQELQYMDVAIRQSSLNARFAYAIAAADRKSADTAKAMMEKLANGETAVVYDPNMSKNLDTGEYTVPWQQFDRDLKANFILPELIDCRRKLMDDFYREMGIKVAPDKKERQITSEQDAYDAETFNRREVWNQCLQESTERVNGMFGLSIHFEYNEPEEEVTLDATAPQPPGRPDERNRGA